MTAVDADADAVDAVSPNHRRRTAARAARHAGLVTLTALPSLVWWAAFRPGLMSSDSLGVWSWANGAPAVDWHPPAYLFVNTVSRVLVGSPSGVAVFQCLLLAAAVVALAAAVAERSGHRRLTVAVTAVLVTTPMYGAFAISLWKDVPYTACALFATAGLVRLITPGRDRGPERVRWLVVVVASLTAMALFRQNGVLAAFGVAALLAAAPVRARRGALAAAVVPVLVLGGAKVVVYPAAHIAPSPAIFKYGSLIQDLAAVAHDGGLSPSSQAALEPIDPVDRLASRYRCGSADPVLFDPSLRPDEVERREADLLTTWFAETLRHPGTVAASRLCGADHMWNPGVLGTARYPLFTVSRGIDANDQGLVTVPVSDRWNRTAAAMLRWLDRPHVQPWVWRAPLWVGAVLVVWAVRRLRRRTDLPVGVLLVPVVLLVAAGVLNVAPDARYTVPAQFCAALLFPLALAGAAGPVEPAGAVWRRRARSLADATARAWRATAAPPESEPAVPAGAGPARAGDWPRRARAGGRRAALVAAFAAPSLAWWLAFRPGLMSVDSVIVWSWANDTPAVDWHPPAYLFVNWLARVTTGSPGPVALAQCVVMAAALVALTGQVARRCRWRRLPWIVAGVVALSPVYCAYTISLWKDIPFTAAAIWTASSLLALAPGGPPGTRRRHQVALVAGLVAMTLFRQNGVLVALGVAGVLVAFRPRFVRLAAVCLAVPALVLVGAKSVVFPAAHIAPTPALLKYSTFIQDLAAVAHDDPQGLAARSATIMDAVAPVPQWRDHYLCYSSNPVLFDAGLDPAQIDRGELDLVTAWLEEAARHPGTVLANRLCGTDIMWNPTPYGSLGNRAYTVETGVVANRYGLRTESSFPWLRARATDLVHTLQSPGWQWFAWRAALWVDVTLVAWVVTRRRHGRNPGSPGRVIAFPVVLLLAAAVLNPAADTRYTWPAQVVAVLLLPLAMAPAREVALLASSRPPEPADDGDAPDTATPAEVRADP